MTKGLCKSCPRKAMHPLGNICRGCKTAQAAWKGHPSTKVKQEACAVCGVGTATEIVRPTGRREFACGTCGEAYTDAEQGAHNARLPRAGLTDPAVASPTSPVGLASPTESLGTRRTGAERNDEGAPPPTSPVR
jgi:hypothetical protein